MLILAAWTIVSQPTDSKEIANSRITKCVNINEHAKLTSHTCKNTTTANYFNCCSNNVRHNETNCTCFHLINGSECSKRLQNITSCSKSTVKTTPTMTTVATTTVTKKSTPTTKNTSTLMSTSTKFFESWANVCFVSVAVSLFIIAFIVVALASVFRRRRNRRRQNHTVKVVPIGEQSVVESVSPIYCEADIFQYSCSEPHSETGETVDTEVNDDESEVEGKYCNPEFFEDEYENMHPVMTPRDSGEYSYPYEHINWGPAYVNTLPCLKQKKGLVKDDYYEYPRTWRRSSDNEYRYAYDWWSIGSSTAVLSSSEPMLEHAPLDKDESFYENDQALSRKSLEDENETVTLEYVTIL